jgi:hypothetical protein
MRFDRTTLIAIAFLIGIALLYMKLILASDHDGVYSIAPLKRESLRDIASHEQHAPERRPTRNRDHDFPSSVAKLPPELRLVVRDLETRAQFLDSVTGFTDEDLKRSRTNAQDIIERLRPDELLALIGFYEDPNSAKLQLNGYDLAGPLLFLALGEKDSDAATKWIYTKVNYGLSVPQGPRHFTGPYPLINAYDVGYLFRGWALRDVDSAFDGWSRIYQDLIASDSRIESRHANELDSIIKASIANTGTPEPSVPPR